MRIYVVITSFNEPATIGKAVEQIICPNKDLWPILQLIVTAPDEPTLQKAEKVCQRYQFENVRLLKDFGQGKPAALNIAVETIAKDCVIKQAEDVLIMTDGDMYIADDAIKNLLKPLDQSSVGGVGGRPVSLDARTTMFGYFSHLFCQAAHKRRLKSSVTPMSGYLYAVRCFNTIFPIPKELRAEDAHISKRIVEAGYKIAYAPDALAFVKFPKNINDWFKQKIRSLGGNVQVGKSTRSVTQDLEMIFFPLFFANSPKELLWSLLLYPLRLLLWVKIYYNHIFNRYGVGVWDRVESSKY